MTINVNETSNITAVEGLNPNDVNPVITAKRLVTKAKEAISTLKGAEARGRKAMASMVAVFVEMGYAYLNDAKVTEALDAMCVKHGLTPVKLSEKADATKPAPNIFLPLVRMVDGDWETVVKDGKPVKDNNGDVRTKWVPNRSYEKYASVIRFFIHNGYESDFVKDLLMGDAPIGTIDGKSIEPLITAIVQADTAQQNPNSRERKVWTAEAKFNAAKLKPIVTIPYTDAMKAAFTLSEDKYGSAIFRLGPKGLEILGDTGLTDNGILGLVKRRTAEMAAAYEKATNMESTQSDD